jgi:hypothetical protein
MDTLWGYSPFWTRWVRFGYFLALVGMAWIVLNIRGSSPFQDKWITLGIGSIFALCSFVMILGTRQWTIRGLGLWGAVTGEAMFYLSIAFPQWGWAEPPSNDYFNVVRALFIVGGTLLLCGLLMWLWRTRFGTRDEPDGAVV